MKKTAPQAGSGQQIRDGHTLPATEAERFLQLLGKDPAKTWFRTFSPSGSSNRRRSGRDLQGLSASSIEKDNAGGEAIYFITGDADSASGRNKEGRRTFCVIDADVHTCRSLFLEWDDQPVEWQATAWKALGLPEPTAMVSTGGNSVHCYWRLTQPMEPEPWKVLQKQLINYCKADPRNKNPSRLMRLPGFKYIDKATGKATDRIAKLIHEADLSYSSAEIAACLPTPGPQKQQLPSVQALAGDLPPRPESELLAALERVPQFFHDEGRRDELLGLAQRLSLEWGVERAHEWMAQHSPSIKDMAGYFRKPPDRLKPGGIWPFLREHYGVDISRRDLKRHQAKPAPRTKGTSNSKPTRSLRRLSHTKAMACFERCVQIQAQRERNSLRRRARLLKAAKDLGLATFVKAPDIAQRVLEAKAHQQGQGFCALSAADRAVMEKPIVRWLLPQLLPANDLTIIGGRPKVGKTRLAMAIAAAVIRGQSFLGMPAPTTTAPVLLVTDDQADGDTAQMLETMRLWESPFLIWSRHFRLTEDDLDALLDTVKANPGALVIIDSLRSISRCLQHGENDPEIGATLYDLKQAVIDSGGTLLLIHHCNKAADLVGTEALSGHNAIAGAANTLITLHYCPDAKDRPDKDSPQRRMFCEGRSVPGCDVVIDRAAGGSFRLVSTFSQWQQQLAEALKQQKQTDQLTPTQQDLLDYLEARPDQRFTRRELVKALELDWGDGGKSSDGVRVRESLDKLHRLELIQKAKIGNQQTYFVSREAQKQSSPSSLSSPSSDCNGSQGEDQEDDGLSLLSIQVEQGDLVAATPPQPALITPRGEDGEVRASPCDPLIRQEGEQREEGEAVRRGGGLIPGLVVGTEHPTGSSWDSGDGDDPAWGPRPEVA